jgi:hypothetical protein
VLYESIGDFFGWQIGVWWERAGCRGALELDGSSKRFAALYANNGAGCFAAEMGLNEFGDSEELISCQ